MEHVLLTCLGDQAKAAHYTLGDGTAYGSELAPIALSRLLPAEGRPTLVRAFCTERATETTWPILERELGDAVELDPIEIPNAETPEEIDQFLRVFADSIPDQGTVTLDVTHGFRHLPFLMFVGALYVSALREISVGAIYYALLKKIPESSPFLDLRRLLDLSRWVHALQTFRETGSAVPIAELIGSDTSPMATRLQKELRAISRFYGAGLPIELGQAAGSFLSQQAKSLRKHLQGGHGLPLVQEVVSGLEESLQELKLSAGDVKPGWKGRLVLNEEELQRQARLIDDLFERENLPAAVGLLREWTVSWATSLRDGQKWLERERRQPAEALLNTLSALNEDKEFQGRLTEEQRALAAFWKDLREVRNSLHHHGMRLEPIFSRNSNSLRSLESVRKYWEETLRAIPRLELVVSPRRYRRLLVSPLGQAPGVLFSAVGACRKDGAECDACLVICSPQTKPSVREGLERAGFQGEEDGVRILCLDDPYAGLGELEQMLNEATEMMLAVESVWVNVTGGTTLMGLLAERAASKAKRMALPVTRFGLIDKRSRQAQLDDAYQQSEVLWLEEGMGDGDD